jgi:hypothetical protein
MTAAARQTRESYFEDSLAHMVSWIGRSTCQQEQQDHSEFRQAFWSQSVDSWSLQRC